MLIRWICEADFPKSQKKSLSILLLSLLGKTTTKKNKIAQQRFLHHNLEPVLDFNSLPFDLNLSEVVLMPTKQNEKCMKT